MFKEFQNLKLEHLRCLEEARIIAAFGFRTCLILNEDLDVMCKILDASKTEKYSCGEFFVNTLENFCSPNRYFFILGGENGIIKILDLVEGVFLTHLSGHTGAICDIKVFDEYIVSSSEDSSIRIWDLKTLDCIHVFGGLFGHKDHVLSIDILHDHSMIVSSGTDCSIKQWKINKEKYFSHQPFTNFNNLHSYSISKIKYYGNMILSLCNGVISMVYNNKEALTENLGLSRDDAILIGTIEVFNNCKTFQVFKHALVGLGSNGDMYVFDLRNIVKEKGPFLLPTNIETTEDFTRLNDYFYISSGNRIHKISFDLSNFE